MSERATGLVEGISAALTGLGALTLAFFPLALPMIALTAVALVPFLVVGLALGALAAPLVLVAWLLRRRRAVGPPRRRLEEAGGGPSPTLPRGLIGPARREVNYPQL